MNASLALTAAGIAGLILILLTAVATIVIAVAIVLNWRQDIKRRRELDRHEERIERMQESGAFTTNQIREMRGLPPTNDDSIFFAVKEAEDDFGR